MFYERHSFNDPAFPVFLLYRVHVPEEPNYELHWHETGEWIYVCEGQVEICIGDQTERYGVGDLIFINPQAPHAFSAVDGHCAYWCMIPDNSLLVTAGIEPSAIYTEPQITDDEIIGLFRDIIEEFRKKDPFFKPCIIGNIVRMTALLIRRHNKQDKHERLFGNNAMGITKEAIKYMEDHYAEDFGGEELAAHLGFSRSYLCHVISSVTGKSLTENLLYIRCRKARDLLRQGFSVGDTAYQVGFRNVSYFCRTYKRLLGETPSAHRTR